MRISVSRHKHQFCLLPTIGILYRLSGRYSVRIAVMWLFWGVSVGIAKNLHYEEDFIWRAFLERKEKENDSE